MRALQYLHCKSSLMLVDQQGIYIYIFFHTKLPKIINVKVHRHIDNLANHQIICYLHSLLQNQKNQNVERKKKRASRPFITIWVKISWEGEWSLETRCLQFIELSSLKLLPFKGLSKGPILVSNIVRRDCFAITSSNLERKRLILQQRIYMPILAPIPTHWKPTSS